MDTTQIPLQNDLEAVIAPLQGHTVFGGIVLDPAQHALAVEISQFLQAAAARGNTTALDHTGYFVYGPPGRGKTWLMTQLFDAAAFPLETKRQVHFHDFFRSLQQHFGAKTSTREAIDATLQELLTGTQLFLFDELHVHDPGSAALLNRLLEAIAAQGIPTLITSNYEPEGLLPDLMFHHVIEPGIQTLRDHFAIRTLDGGMDYRAESAASDSGFSSGRWLVAAPGHHPEEALRTAGLHPPSAGEVTTVLEKHRTLRALAVRGSEIWFDFADLLQANSVTSDFIDLVEDYDAWVLTGVPKLSATDPAARQRFVTLIDVLVTRDVPLTVLAEVSREHLIDLDNPPPDLFRTVSRLALLGS